MFVGVVINHGSAVKFGSNEINMGGRVDMLSGKPIPHDDVIKRFFICAGIA